MSEGTDGAPGTNGSGGAPSAADLLGVDAGGGEGGGEKVETGGEGEGGGGGEGGGADPDWYAQVSAETVEGEKSSLHDFVKASGVKDINTLVQRFRDTQRALHEGGKIKVPGEGASESEVKAYRLAIGVPDDVKGYALEAIRDAKGVEIPLDGPLLDRLALAALKAGVPKTGYQQLVTEYVHAQVEEIALADAQQKLEATAKIKEWGPQANAKTAAVNAGLEALGISRDETLKLRAALGAGRALDIFATLGEGVAEDTLVHGDQKGHRFGISGAQAQEEINKMIADRAMADKIVLPGTPEHARYERLQAIVGEDANRKAAALQ